VQAKHLLVGAKQSGAGPEGMQQELRVQKSTCADCAENYGNVLLSEYTIIFAHPFTSFLLCSSLLLVPDM
jgi:hypothetical protein